MTRYRFIFVSFLLLGFGSILLAQESVPTPDGEDRLTIEQAVAEAVDKNLDLIAERYNLSIADARIVTARPRPNPVVGIGGDHLDLLGTGFNTATNNGGPTEYSVRTDFVLESGGKRQVRIAAAEGNRAVAQLQLLHTLLLSGNDTQDSVRKPYI
jgi:cobalt-zinc-cadmium efflux system outer membrane protein